jgi:hypothetical protein
MHCANFPRHLGRLITRCLIAHPEGADTIELAHWAYGDVLPRYGGKGKTGTNGRPFKGLFAEHRGNRRRRIRLTARPTEAVLGQLSGDLPQ